MKFHTVDISEPRDGDIVFKDYYWLCKHGNSKEALFYSKSPQCNKNQIIIERMLNNSLYKNLIVEGYTVTFIQLAYVPKDKTWE